MKLTWIGQAGYCLRADNGKVIMIDPYLSDSLRYKKGESYHREVEIREEFLHTHVDVLVLTHLHEDHTNFETLDVLFDSNGPIDVLAPLSILNELRQRYTKKENWMLFFPGVETILHGICFKATFAAHSSEGPIGLVIEGDGKVICHTGDTMYHSRLRQEIPQQADALMLPINGSGYNMNAKDAARLTKELRPKAVYPMHWELFRAYGCDVTEFTSEFTAEDACKIVIPEHYQEVDI